MKYTLKIAILLFLQIFVYENTFAVTYTFKGPGQSWTDPANWKTNPATPGTYPQTATDDVVIPTGFGTVTFPNNTNISLRTLVIAGTSVLNMTNNIKINISSALYVDGANSILGGGNNDKISGIVTATGTQLDLLNGEYGNFLPFPVKLLEFNSAINSNNSIILNWKTEQEINFDKFNIQKSFDAKSFESIGLINSKGSSDYSFIDLFPKRGQNYYRLKMIDFDGSFKYSKIISTFFDFENQQILYPNPSENNEIVIHDIVNIEKVSLTDLLGRKVSFTSKVSGNETIISVSQALVDRNLVISYYTSDSKYFTKRVLIK